MRPNNKRKLVQVLANIRQLRNAISRDATVDKSTMLQILGNSFDVITKVLLDENRERFNK